MKTLLSGRTKSTPSQPITLTEAPRVGWTVKLVDPHGKPQSRTFGVYPPALALYVALAVNPIASQ